MRKIYKYEMSALSEHHIPEYPEYIHVGLDAQSRPCLWALVEPEKPLRLHRFQILGTGCDVTDDYTHRGSWVSGSYVWHLFEKDEV